MVLEVPLSSTQNYYAGTVPLPKYRLMVALYKLAHYLSQDQQLSYGWVEKHIYLFFDFLKVLQFF